MQDIKKEGTFQSIKINAGDKFLVQYHYELINKFLNKHLKGWMKSTHEVHTGLEMWFIRLDGFESDSGWTNKIENEDLITEIYTGDKSIFKEDHKFQSAKRLVFDIKNIAGKRTYIFKGVFEPSHESNDYLRLWRRVSDSFTFV